MRFEKTIPKYGNRRVREEFLLFPMSVYTRHESNPTIKSTRWFEMGKWEEEFTKGRGADFWKKIRWID